jgi:hypothetical protein
VQVGSEYLFDTETQGVLQFAPSMLPLGPSGSDAWVYILTVVLPDGSAGITFAILPVDPLDIPPLAHYYVWRRTAKPSVGAQFTGPGGSLWVYRRSGLYSCWSPGGGYKVDDTAPRSVIDGVTAPNPPIVDPLWDWEPITDNSVTVGDYLLWSFGVVGLVDSIGYPDEAGETNYYDGVDQLGVLNQDDTRNHTTVMDRRVYLTTTKPDVGTRFRSTDNAEWVVTGSGAYRCYKTGTKYTLGAVYQRLNIDSTLTSL